MKLNLQQFAGALTAAVTKDVNAHWTAASISPASSLSEGDKATLTLTPASGYQLDEIIITGGGAEGPYWDETNSAYYINMGASNATLFVKSMASNLYKVVENTPVWVNGTLTELKRNMTLVRHNGGAIIDVECDGTAITLDTDIVNQLVKNGVIVHIEGKQKKVAEPEDET